MLAKLAVLTAIITVVAISLRFIYNNTQSEVYKTLFFMLGLGIAIYLINIREI